jgi:hypothetical protein
LNFALKAFYSRHARSVTYELAVPVPERGDCP